MLPLQENSTLSSLIFEPKKQIWRYLFFIFTGIIIIFGQVFVVFQDSLTVLGCRIYLIGISLTVVYGLAGAFNIYLLIPRLLLKEKYVLYTIIFAFTIFCLPILGIVQEYWVRTSLNLPHRITSYSSPLILIDNLALFLVTFICFWSYSIKVILGQWLSKKEHISLMEYNHLRTEVNKLKGQITPNFLSKTLSNTSALVKSNPTKASDMLKQLSKLLRYQLYDSQREKILLKAEIKFIEDFLNLEQLNRDSFKYNIEVSKELDNIFVAPLAFISFIQSIVDKVDNIEVLFEVQNTDLVFRCQSTDDLEFPKEQIDSSIKSLDLLYPRKYNLEIDKRFLVLKINIAK